LAKYAAKRIETRKGGPRPFWATDAYTNAKARATKAGVPFTITKDDILRALGDVCPVFGKPFVYGAGRTVPESPSLDRKVAGLGYTPDNIWVISAYANRIKSDANSEDVLRVGRAMAAEGL
jgi:hypothetical protein